MERDFQTEVITRLTKIETKLDDYHTIKAKSESADARSIKNEAEIDEINEKLKWITRTTVGAIIAGLVGIVISLIKINIGG